MMAVFPQWLLVILLSLPLGNSQTDGGLGQCTNLSDTSFTINAQPDESYSLPCQKNCSAGTYRWFHAFTHYDQLIRIQEGQHLDLTITMLPTQSIVGYFCCACSGQYVLGTSCCHGVAYSPQVITFAITQNGKSVTAIHEGESFTLECEVYGYPEVDSKITGPGTLQEDYKPILENRRWYSTYKTVNITHANESFTGMYQCKGQISFTQGGETVIETSDDAQRKDLVVYKRPTITRLSQEGAADDQITLVCDVECSVDYNVSWLHNREPVAITEGGKYQQYISDTSHKLIVQITSPNDTGNYTCVVNTVYKVNETSRSLKLSIGLDPAQAVITGHIGPVQDPSSGTDDLKKKVIVVVSVSGAVLLIAGIVVVYFVRKAAPRLGGAGNHDDERAHLTDNVRESGDDLETDSVSREEVSSHPKLEKKGLGYGFVPHRRKQKPVTL